MLLGNGITGSVVGGLYAGYPGTAQSAFSPPPATYPENSQTVTAAAFGPQGGTAGGGMAPGHKAGLVAALAFGALVFMWFSLPR